MRTPIYAGAEPPESPKDGHHGLWYDRFFNRYSENWLLDETAKKAWVDTVAHRVGDHVTLETTTLRSNRLCATLGGQSRVYRAVWHLATGLGNPHPVKNGFLWHPVLGTPYVPGSAVKGLVRAWVEAWMPFESDQDRLDTLYRWFGSEDKDFRKRKKLRAEGYRPPTTGHDPDTEAGAFIYFDALPVAPLTLKCDVMTPHMGKWYEQGGEIEDLDSHPEAVPADWHDPLPVYFLVVDRPAFQFSVAPRTESAKTELDHVLSALHSALEWLGVGAKTAVGYGLMDRDHAEENRIRESILNEEKRLRDLVESAEREKKRQAQLETMTPLEREIDEVLQNRIDKNRSEIAAIIAEVKQGRWQGREKKVVAHWLEEEMKKAAGQWKPQTQAKRPEKDRAHQNTLLVIGWQKE